MYARAMFARILPWFISTDAKFYETHGTATVLTLLYHSIPDIHVYDLCFKILVLVHMADTCIHVCHPHEFWNDQHDPAMTVLFHDSTDG